MDPYHARIVALRNAGNIAAAVQMEQALNATGLNTAYMVNCELHYTRTTSSASSEQRMDVTLHIDLHQ